MSVSRLGDFPHTIGNLVDRPNLNGTQMKAKFEQDVKTLWEKVDESIGEMNKGSNQFASERVFRIAGKETGGVSNIGAQSMTSTGSSFLLSGPVNSGETKTKISEYSLSGEYVRSAVIENAYLTHCNGMTYDASSDTIYIVNARTDQKIVAIDYQTLSIKATYDVPLQNASGSVIGIACYDGKLYVYCVDGGAYQCDLGTFDPQTSTYTVIGSFKIGFLGEGYLHAVLQDMEVYGDYAYIFTNWRNEILKIRLSDAVIDDVIVMGEGNGYFPYGEVESGAFIDGQLYFMSALYFSGNFKSRGIHQIFKSNIGGTVQEISREGQHANQDNYVYVNFASAASTYVNPYGGDDAPFETIGEACAFLNYQSGVFSNYFSRLYIRDGGGYDYSDDTIYLRRQNIQVICTNSVACDYAFFTDGSKIIIYSLKAYAIASNFCDLCLIGCTISAGIQAVSSRIYVDSTSTAAAYLMISSAIKLDNPSEQSKVTLNDDSSRYEDSPNEDVTLTNQNRPTIILKRRGRLLSLSFVGTISGLTVGTPVAIGDIPARMRPKSNYSFYEYCDQGAFKMNIYTGGAIAVTPIATTMTDARCQRIIVLD